MRLPRFARNDRKRRLAMTPLFVIARNKVTKQISEEETGYSSTILVLSASSVITGNSTMKVVPFPGLLLA